MLETVLAFVPVAVVLAVSPGPQALMTVRYAVTSGRATAWRAAGGTAVGLLGWVLAAMAGVTALVAASHAAFVGLRVVGAVVLVGFGVAALRRAVRGVRRPPAAGPAARSPRPFTGGLVTALANPKAALFYLTVVPQFVPPAGPVAATVLVLGLVHVVIAVGWHLVLATATGWAGERVLRPRAQAAIEAAGGVALLGFGARLATTSR